MIDSDPQLAMCHSGGELLFFRFSPSRVEAPSEPFDNPEPSGAMLWAAGGPAQGETQESEESSDGVALGSKPVSDSDTKNV